MEKMNIISLSITTTILVLVTAENYCDPYFCANSRGKKHIACNNDGVQFSFICDLGASCPANARVIDMRPIIRIILAEHNKGRNLLAGGELMGYGSAARMATMQWDNELARMATLNVNQCIAKLDGCRNTRRFKYSGQNIHQISYDGSEEAFSDTDIIQNGIVKWFAEYKSGTMAAMRNFPTRDFKPFGHFALIAIDENNYVGCAALRFTNKIFNNVILTCNYAKSLIGGRAIYKEGPAASGCRNGKNEQFSNLCSIDETYGVMMDGF